MNLENLKLVKIGLSSFISIKNEGFEALDLLDCADYPKSFFVSRWTRDHIRAFGGNPDNITILGESSGAMAVNCHVLSPMSKGLFHRAVSHSGSVFMGRSHITAACLLLYFKVFENKKRWNQIEQSYLSYCFVGFPGKSGPAPLQLLAEELKLNEKDPETLIKILQTLPAEDIQKVLGRLVEVSRPSSFSLTSFLLRHTLRNT